MAVAQNNKLEFEKLFEHHPFEGKGSRVEHPLMKHFFMKDDVNDGVPNGTPKTLIPFDEVVN